MILCIGEVLDEAQCASIRTSLADRDFVEGRRSAGFAAREVKHTLQLPATDPAHASASAIILAALSRHALFQSAARPRSFTTLLFSRAEIGMSYGMHVDNALMGEPPVRTDLAFTLFLAPPDTYAGGELVIDDAGGEQSYKLPAGSLVLYPATTLHRVAAVERGTRLVAAGWIQSLIRDPRLREMLFDLERARQSVYAREGKSETFDLLAKSVSNLLRMFAET